MKNIIGAIVIAAVMGACNQNNEQKNSAQEETDTKSITSNQNQMKKVSFTSEGATLVGNLYLPPEFDESKK